MEGYHISRYYIPFELSISHIHLFLENLVVACLKGKQKLYASKKRKS